VLSNRITRYLGEISFSTYIVHANILYELGRAGLYTWVFQSMPGREVAAYFVCFALSLVIITAVAAITYRLIEVPGMRLGRKRSSEVPASAA
jgi:peptidoglycan/LPS O-acetylase OafA/YrhL